MKISNEFLQSSGKIFEAPKIMLTRVCAHDILYELRLKEDASLLTFRRGPKGRRNITIEYLTNK